MLFSLEIGLPTSTVYRMLSVASAVGVKVLNGTKSALCEEGTGAALEEASND
jgi:hypothetical protein